MAASPRIRQIVPKHEPIHTIKPDGNRDRETGAAQQQLVHVKRFNSSGRSARRDGLMQTENQRFEGQGKIVSLGCIGLSVLSLLIAALPFMGVGDFKYSGEGVKYHSFGWTIFTVYGVGFCYFDWYDKTHMSLTFIVSIITLVGGLVLFAMAVLQSQNNKFFLAM